MLEEELSDPAGSAADVEDARGVVRARYFERELAPVEEPWAEGALERVLFVVEVVKRERLLAKVLANAPRRVGGCRHMPVRSSGAGTAAQPPAAAAR